jgi:hypothetical protein
MCHKEEEGLRDGNGSGEQHQANGSTPVAVGRREFPQAVSRQGLAVSGRSAVGRRSTGVAGGSIALELVCESRKRCNDHFHAIHRGLTLVVLVQQNL